MKTLKLTRAESAAYSAGERRFWIHKGDKRVDGPERAKYERYFWKGKP